MTHNYTSNNLIRFIYGEASLKEYYDLDDAMESDPALRLEFRNLYDCYRLLPEATLSPSDKSINNILRLSRQSMA